MRSQAGLKESFCKLEQLITWTVQINQAVFAKYGLEAAVHMSVANKSIAVADFVEPTCLAEIHCGDYIQTRL